MTPGSDDEHPSTAHTASGEAEASEAYGASDIVELLRLWGGAFGEFGHLFGLEAGMHVTDSDALVQIINAEDRGAPLRQAELSRRIGLSTGATSSLINRLEGAGHVRRVRDSRDRRVVTMRSTAAVHDRVHDFFERLGNDLEQSIAGHSPEALRQFGTLLTEVNSVMMRHLSAHKTR